VEPERYSGAWNFGPSPTDRLTVLEVTKSFFSSLGIGSIELDEPDETRQESDRLRLAIDKALCELQWQPTLTSRTAINWTASWYRGWLEDPRRTFERSLGQIRVFCEQASRAKATGSHQT
jgi:CDP-glucose 4,6-dehydratase